MRRLIVNGFFLLLLLALSFLLPRWAWLQAWDYQAVRWLSEHRSEYWIPVFIALTNLGGAYAIFIAAIGLCIERLWRRQVLQALIYVLGILLLKFSVSELKVAIARPRPGLGIVEAWGFSMPSGHAFNAVLLYGFLGMSVAVWIVQPSLRFFVKLLLVVMILLIAFSRVYLGVHYPTDVIVGMLYALVVMNLLKAFQSPPKESFQKL